MTSARKRRETSPLQEEGTPLNQTEASDTTSEQQAEAEPAIPESFCRRIPMIGTCLKLYDLYDATFLTMLGMQYFNQGTKVLVYLASADLYKTVLKLEPGEVQLLQAFTFLPWSMKILYGLISDNVPIFGSRRKSYLILGAILQFLSMVVLGQKDMQSEKVATWCLFLSNLAIAFSDVIVDSLMVIQSRKYPESGSEDLNAFTWTCMSVGGLFGSIIAAFLTESYEPRYCFLFSSVMGLVIAFFATRIDVSLEKEGLEAQTEGQQGFWVDFKRNCREIVEAFTVKEFRNVILYLVASGLLVPSFGTFGYYFMMNTVGISKFAYAMLTVLGYGCLLLGTQLFNKYFKDKEYRYLIIMDAILTIILSPFTFAFITRLNLEWGVPDMVMIIFTDTVSDIVSMCFIFLPMSVVMTKICPKNIEATSFALLAGVSNFRGTLRSWIGSWVNETFVGVTEQDLSQYWVLVTISLVCSLLPLLFLWLVPTQKQIEELQERMRLADIEEKATKEKKDEKEIDVEEDEDTAELNKSTGDTSINEATQGGSSATSRGKKDRTDIHY